MSTTTTYTGVRIVDMPDLGALTDDSSVVGEHAGSGRFSATALRNYLSPCISVKSYGARGDGVADDTAAFQSAAAAAIAAQRELCVESGNYRISSSIVINGAITVRGVGSTSNIVQSDGVTIFIVTTADPVLFDNLMFGKGLTATLTAGAAILVDTGSGGPPGGNEGSSFINLKFMYQRFGIQFVRSSRYYVANCQFLWGYIGIWAQNLANADAGDSIITGCSFAQNATLVGYQGAAIYQVSSGGLKIIGNKMNGHQYGYLLSTDYAGGTGTVDLVLTGNSIENQGQAAICLNQGHPGENFYNVVIADNQIALGDGTGSAANANANAILIGADSAGGNWVTGFVISNNQILVKNGPAILIESGLVGVINNNSINSYGTATVGIQCESPVNFTRIGADNTIVNVTTPILNSSAGVSVAPVVRAGSMVIVLDTATTVTGIFAGIAGLSGGFGYTYTNGPTVQATVAGTGALSVVVGSVTATSCTFEVYGTVNGASLTVYWQASGY